MLSINLFEGKTMFNAFICVLVLYGTVWGVSADPNPLELVQPDGTVFTAFQRGDEWQNWFENEAGYTIVKNAEEEWMFAKEVINGQLVPSNLIVNSSMDDPNDSGLNVEPHLKPDPIQRYVPDQRMGGVNPSPQRTDYNLAMLLVEYPDDTATYTVANFDNLMNQNNYNGTGSFNDYYNEVSYGQFNSITTIAGWYTATNNHDYYGYNNGYGVAEELVIETIAAAEAAGFDFSPFDNDGDGYVDVVNIVHAGAGAEEGDLTNIWSHRSWLYNPVQYDGVYIRDYTFNPETQWSGMTNIGVIAHEFGHALNLPDLYDTDNSSAGGGNWCLMAGGAWGGNGYSPEYPTHMNAWSKTELGWMTPTVVSADQSGTSLAATETTAEAIRINNPHDSSEYFLLENRQLTGFDINMYSSGLLIWHIDEEMTDLWPGQNNVNASEPHYGVGLEQADGFFDLENNNDRGDDADPYPGSTGNTSFSGSSLPNSHSYYNVTSMVAVDNIVESGSDVTFDIIIGSASTEVTASITATGSGASWDTTGGVFVALDNDVSITSLECLIYDDPDVLEIVGVEPTTRTQGMTITYEEETNGMATVNISGGTISAGTGNLFEVNYYASTGVSQTVDLALHNVTGTDASGDGLVVTMDATEYEIESGRQEIKAVGGSALPGGISSIDIYLNNNMDLGYVFFHLRDLPNELSFFQEIYTDANGNGEYDDGEDYEDANSDGSWTDYVTLSDRIGASWDVSASDAAGRFIVTAEGYSAPIQPDTTLLMTLHLKVADDAAIGEIGLDFAVLGLRANEGESYLDSEGIDGTFTVTAEVGVGPESLLPNQYALYQNFPNPFNPMTHIQYDLPEQTHVSIVIYDLMGRKVSALINDIQNPGKYKVLWDGIDSNGILSASGIYIYQLQTQNTVMTKKMVFIK